MAARTFNSAGVNNLWSNPANWDGGVSAPVDNDSVTVPVGQVCEFDVDQSAMPNGMDGITVSGTLKLSRAAGTYQLKVKAAKWLGGAGVFDCGTQGDPIPFAAKHTITGGAAWYIKGNDGAGLTFSCFAAEPTFQYVRLSADEAIGQTVLSVDTDVTGDLWRDGDYIVICDINKGSETAGRTIAAGGIGANTITVTAGLTEAKSTGAYVVLVTRNVRFVGGGTVEAFRNFSAGKMTIGGGDYTTSYRHFGTCNGGVMTGGVIWGGGYCLNFSQQWTISGGVFVACGYMGNQSNGCSITGGLFAGNSGFYQPAGLSISGGLWVGCNQAISNGVGCGVSGGTFYGCQSGVTYSSVEVTGGVYTNNAQALYASAGSYKNMIMSGNSNDIDRTFGKFFNCAFGSASENNGYTSLAREAYCESIDHDQVAGAFKAWTKGGVTNSQAVTVPTGYSKANQTVLSSAISEGYWQKELLVAAGASVEIEMHLRKDAAMAYLPRCLVFNKALTDPLGGGGTLHTFTMTDSVDTWESELFTFTNAGAEDVTMVIRFQGMNAGNNLYSALKVNVINVDLTSALSLLNAIKAKTDNLPADPADESNIQAAFALIPPAPSAAAIRAEMDASSAKLAAILDATSVNGVVLGQNILEGELTLQEALRIILSAVAGKATGGGTGTIKFRDQADKKNRITASVDANGNRSKVLVDGK